MSISENIENAMSHLQSIFDKKLSPIYAQGSGDRHNAAILEAIYAAQGVYNLLESAIQLLQSNPNEDKELIKRLRSDCFGSELKAEPCVTVTLFRSPRENYWKYSVERPCLGGIGTILDYLHTSLSSFSTSSKSAVCICSAKRVMKYLWGSTKRLLNRLEWSVMYPDSFSRDSAVVRARLEGAGFSDAWNQFSSGIENYISGNYPAAINSIRNALTHLMKDLAKKYHVDDAQLGTQRLGLKNIEFISANHSDEISKFYGHLSKFSKANAVPTVLDARYLLDWAFTIFGYLTERMEEFKAVKKRAFK